MMISEKHILLDTNIMNLYGYWTTLAHISDVDLQSVHKHIILVNTTSCASENEKRNVSLLFFEFYKGSPVSVENIDDNFFMELIDCL